MLIQLKAFDIDSSQPFLVIRERKKGGKPPDAAIVRLIRGARVFFGENGLPSWAAIELDYLQEDYAEAFGNGWEIKRLPPIWRPLKGEAIVYQAGNTTWKIVYTF